MLGTFACGDDTGTEDSSGDTEDTETAGDDEIDSSGEEASTTADTSSTDTDDASTDTTDASTDTSDTTDDASTDTTDTAESDTAESDTTETGDTTDGNAAICGDAEVSGDEACDDGVNDGSYGGCAEDCMSLGPHCGDAEVNGPETCDDANEDSADGCLASCIVPASCLEILEFDALAESGAYQVGVMGPDAVFEVDCDMDTDGGGWTGLLVTNTCNGDLESLVTAVEAAPTEGIDDTCRPFTQDTSSYHTYYWDIEFPPTFEAFYLSEFTIKANAGAGDTSDIYPGTFAQSDWSIAHQGAGVGDVSFGAAENTGPTTSFGATLDANFECLDCEGVFPEDMVPFAVDTTSSAFRIGWGEAGGQTEGWYPWWSGAVYLR
ncbi:fibrinogen-like YCDxxxxGGGW domain-containing protein [Pseudenhygromyxa sp. WMMC2535]|uniref:fibrinogen-like YCDxxxxGGGW domain-containing protein n=1 Tax=Pseudenhygromyxa sp. WMMC2535 TaxID=2712867 RepID=UPI0020D19BCE|nr:fibrinogen-like YCDxxxxGGGW domain-containing protein [Pseudenhygromyxa sp. WMMC2535]